MILLILAGVVFGLLFVEALCLAAHRGDQMIERQDSEHSEKK